MDSKPGTMEINYYQSWTVREIEIARDEVHAEIGAVLIGGLSSEAKTARLGQLTRQRAGLERALELKWKEGVK